VRKDFVSRIVLKVTEPREIVGWLVTGYQGIETCLDVWNVFVRAPPEVDHVAFWGWFLMISLFSEQPFEFRGEFESIQKWPAISEEDVFFLPTVPAALDTEEKLGLFLFSFGYDHRVAYEPWYTRVQIHHALASMRFRTFVPFIQIDDRHIVFDTFPRFVPVVRASLPPSYSIEECRALFGAHGTVTEVTFLRRRVDNDPIIALASFDNIVQVDSALSLNFSEVHGHLVYGSRFTDENHLRFLRYISLVVREDCSDERGLWARFARYGEVFRATFDSDLNVGSVYFFSRRCALRAAESEPNTAVMPSGTSAYIRNLPLDTSEPRVLELTRKFGKVVSVVFRDLDDFMHRRSCLREGAAGNHVEEGAAPSGVPGFGPRDQRDRPEGD
jgi:hypothetical protein